MYSRIAGTGSYLPERILTNFDLERMMDTTDEWIRDRTGIERRHIRPRSLGASRLRRVFLRMLRRIALLGALRHGPNMGRVCRRGK